MTIKTKDATAKQICQQRDELLKACILAAAALENALCSAGMSTAGYIATRNLMSNANIAVRAAIDSTNEQK